MRPILILGAYGNFGKRIAHALSRAEYPVVVAGRNARKAATVMAQLPGAGHEIAVFDVNLELDRKLRELDPCVVVNTCGPFQNADYRIAETCINRQVPYIDLADGRKFVAGIAALDSAAVESNTTVISGASTVPGLSSAVVEEYAGEFSELRTMVYGISPGQKAERGLATTQAIMSYVGKPLAPIGPDNSVVYGWQDIYRQTYPELGKRWMANCDIPDLDLFPERYGIAQINFSAGVELAPLHFGLWGLSWLVRWGLPLDLPRWSRALLAASNLFDGFGSADGVMHIISWLSVTLRPRRYMFSICSV